MILKNMMRSLTALLIALISAQGAMADPGVAKKSCAACHAIETKLLGPAFRDVAAKYRGVSGAEAFLARKIRAGSSGVWGPTAMPPSTQISERDARILAQWVLGS
jgi:cytochrome c